jgi:hypothetical protein
MRPIRLIERTNRAKAISPFAGVQVDICDVTNLLTNDLKMFVNYIILVQDSSHISATTQ